MSAATITRRCFIASATALPWCVQARPASAAPLLLAMEAPADVDPGPYLVSEKYDGVRAQWDGRSLRFRSGLPISAPAWFTARLPLQALDGELWFGRGRFEALSGAVRRAEPDDGEWRQLHYMVFELPGAAGPFEQRAATLHHLAAATGWSQLVAAPQQRVANKAALQQRLNAVVAGGGEGLVLHRADAAYTTGRSPLLLKLKPLHDAEAVVVAHLPGRGRLAGRMGALRVRLDDGTVFDIGTGFSDSQRAGPPPLGSVVSFTHRGFTEGGVPRFASFLRLHAG